MVVKKISQWSVAKKLDPLFWFPRFKTFVPRTKMLEIFGLPLKYFIPLYKIHLHYFPRVYEGGPNISPEIIDAMYYA